MKRLIYADDLLDRVKWANTNWLIDHGEMAVKLIEAAPTIEELMKLTDVFMDPSVLDGRDGDETILVSMTVDDLKHIYDMTLKETAKKYEQQS